ncbi:MAG TPA: hypothetical protein VGK19_24250 [Capsulimonadaceae bacterium]|jgi:hypothetical protein
MSRTKLTHTGIAAIITLATLSALLAIPATRIWLLNDTLSVVGRENLWNNYRQVKPVAGDYETDLALTVNNWVPGAHSSPATSAPLAEQLAGLVKLQSQYPNRAGVDARMFDVALSRSVVLGRPSGVRFGFELAPYKPAQNDPAVLASLISSAEHGAVLEPENGYFAMLEAAAYYAANRDADGLAALERAGACTTWDDHTSERVIGELRMLSPSQRRDNSTVASLASMASVETYRIRPLFRALGRLIMAEAVAHEINGEFKRGARERRALRRTAVLMRDHSRTAIDSMTGSAAVALANARPGGQNVLPCGTGDQRAVRLGAMAAYFRLHGFTADAVDVEKQYKLELECSSIIKTSLEKTLSRWHRFSSCRAALQACEAVVLTLLAWMILAAILGRARALWAEQELAAPVRRGIATGVAAALALTVILTASETSLILNDEVTNPRFSWLPYSFACLVVAGIFASCRRFPAAARSPRIPWTVLIIATVTWACIGAFVIDSESGFVSLSTAVVLVVSAVVLRRSWRDFARFGTAFMLATVAVWVFFGLAQIWTDCADRNVDLLVEGSSKGYAVIERVIAWLITSAIPALIALIAAIVARVKRRPAGSVIVHAWRTTLPWVVCALTVTYACVAVPTVRLNDKLCAQTMQRIDDEPGAMARELGRTWPGR